MANPNHSNTTQLDLQTQQDLPLVIVLKPPPVLTIFEHEFSKRFQILKAWDSDLVLDQFLASQAQSVHAMLCYTGGPQISANVIRLLPSLRLIVTTSAGLDHIELSECRRRGIAIVTAGDLLSDDVADMAVGLLIDVLRKISVADRYVRNGNWATLGDFPLGSQLGGKKIGIVGLGRIGLKVAKRLEAFGCKISYNSRKKKDSVSYPYFPNVSELAANCDAFIISCGLNEQSRHMIDRNVLLRLGKEGVIVNIGRGAIINEKELVECLVKGDIGGAGLDVFENEPNVPNELSELDNVVLSPHRAVYTPESLKDLCQLIIGALEAFFSNKPLLSLLVDK